VNIGIIGLHKVCLLNAHHDDAVNTEYVHVLLYFEGVQVLKSRRT